MAFGLLLSFLFAAPASAQVTDTRPVRIKIKTEKPKQDSFRGEVIDFTPTSVTVRDRNNYAVLRTFTFSPELARQVENRHMEHGDRVEVRYNRGSNTAVKLKGKLRKPQFGALPQTR